MEIKYDETANVLIIRFKREKIAESEEVDEGVIVDYNSHGEVVAIEILNPKGKIDLNKLVFEKKLPVPILLG